MKLIQYEGNEKYFFALTQDDKENYYMFFANVGNVFIESQCDNNYIDFYKEFTTHFSSNKSANLHIDFLNKDQVLFKMIQLKSKEDYNTIITVVKDLL